MPSVLGSCTAIRSQGGHPLPLPRTRPSIRSDKYTADPAETFASAICALSQLFQASRRTGAARQRLASSSSSGRSGVTLSSATGTAITPRSSRAARLPSAAAMYCCTSSAVPATMTGRANWRSCSRRTRRPLESSTCSLPSVSSREMRCNCLFLASLSRLSTRAHTASAPKSMPKSLSATGRGMALGAPRTEAAKRATAKNVPSPAAAAKPPNKKVRAVLKGAWASLRSFVALLYSSFCALTTRRSRSPRECVVPIRIPLTLLLAKSALLDDRHGETPTFGLRTRACGRVTVRD
mmetsp:Transcript_31722/g.69327  ORF Transcript_31722/g.69327 Transcript_31722/m.69327 type:complete len:294 (-) Transcript_31722:117-998(-)